MYRAYTHSITYIHMNMMSNHLNIMCSSNINRGWCVGKLHMPHPAQKQQSLTKPNGNSTS